MNSDPLEIALGATKPLPASNLEECRELLEVERLAKPHHVTVDHHQQFRESITRPCDRFDEIDLAMAIPDPPQKRSERESRRILDILDQLERGDG